MQKDMCNMYSIVPENVQYIQKTGVESINQQIEKY